MICTWWKAHSSTECSTSVMRYPCHAIQIVIENMTYMYIIYHNQMANSYIKYILGEFPSKVRCCFLHLYVRLLYANIFVKLIHNFRWCDFIKIWINTDWFQVKGNNLKHIYRNIFFFLNFMIILCTVPVKELYINTCFAKNVSYDFENCKNTKWSNSKCPQYCSKLIGWIMHDGMLDKNKSIVWNLWWKKSNMRNRLHVFMSE